MTARSYPDFEPAWVEESDAPGVWALWWIEDGKPVERIGVDREFDVPGIHTPSALAAIQAMPLEKQAGRMWTQIPASEPQSDAAA